MTLKKCYECDTKTKITDYHIGYEENNKDESSTGICQKCGEVVRIYWNYDDRDDIIRIYGNNGIAFGNFFKGYQKHQDYQTSDKVHISEIESILKKSYIYEISIPSLQLDKRKLGVYIKEQIDNDSTIIKTDYI